MEEKEKMDYQYLTRKQLQALCKKHGVPANLTNREMAHRLSSFLKESEKLTSPGESSRGNSRVKMNENGSKAKTKVVKKVRFSPETETFAYQIPEYKRGGRRRCTMGSRPMKQIQPPPVERKGVKRDVNCQIVEVNSAGGCDDVELGVGNVSGELHREVVVGKSDGDLVPTRKRAKRDVEGQSVEVKSNIGCDVVELGGGNVSGGLIRRQLRNRDVVVEKNDGELVPPNKNAKGRSSKMVRNGVISKIGGTFTRSRAQSGDRDSEIGEDREGCEKVPILEEPSKGVGRNVLVRKSAEAEMGLQKTKQEVAKDEGSEMLSGNSRKVESVSRITRSRAKTGEEACAAESKNGEETVQPEELSNGLSKYASRRKSVVSNKSKKRSRNSVLEGASDPEAIQDASKVFEMVKNVSVPSGPSRRTRRSTVMFKSTVSVDLETQQNVGQKEACSVKIVSRRSRRNVMYSTANTAEPNKVLQQTESHVVKELDSEILSGTTRRFKSVNETKKSGKACAAESENVEGNVQLVEHSKGYVKQASKRKSVVSQKGKVGSDGLQVKKESRKRSRDNDLKGVSGQDVIVEPSTEIEMVKNVSVPSGPSRRTRRNTVMLKSSILANEPLENHQTAGQKNINLSKNPRKSNRLASRVNTTVTSSEVDGTAVDVGKIRRQKRRQGPIVDEVASLGKCKPLTKRAEPTEPSGKAVGKKQYGRSKMSITEKKAPCSEKLSAPEDGRLAVEEAANYKNNVDASYSRRTLGSLKKKREASRGNIGTNKQQGSFEAYAVNSDTEEAVDATVNLEETSVSTLVKLQCVSTDQVAQNSVRNVVCHEEFSLVEDVLDGDRDEKSCWSMNKMDDIGNGNLVEQEMITSPAAGFSPSNQSNDSAEPSSGKNINHRSDDVDDQSNKDEISLVQEYQNLEQVEDAQENTVEPLVQGGVLEKRSEISQDITEGKVKIGPSDVAEICHTECFPEAFKVQEFTAESHFVTTETQWDTGCDDTTEATPCKLELKCQEVNEVKEQTVLESSNTNFIGQEEFSVKGREISAETTYGCETSVRKAWNQIHSQAKTKDNLKNDRTETEEAFYRERGSHVVGEKIINKGYHGKLLVGSSPVSIKINVKDASAKENEVSEQNLDNVSKDIGGKRMQELLDAAVSSSELVLEKFYDDTEIVQETNCSFNIAVEDVPFNQDYGASSGIDVKSLNGESDVEQCADVAREENPECTLKVELGNKSVHEVVATPVNCTAGTSLTEFISKESEVCDQKADGTMLKPAECVDGVDKLKVEESRFEDRNSDTEVIAVAALAQVSGNYLVEDEAMDERDGSVQNERIVDREAQKWAPKAKDLLDEVGNVEILVPVSPMILGNTFGDEFAEINDRTTGVSSDRSKEVMGFVPQVDEVNFGDLDNFKKENVSYLERNSSVTSDNLMATNSRAADIKEKVETTAGGLDSNSISSDAEKEDNDDAIPQVTIKDTDEYLPEAKLCNADDSDQCVLLNCASPKIGVAAADALEVLVDGKTDSKNTEAGTNWIQKTPIFLKKNKDERNHVDKNSAEGTFFADTTFDKPEVSSVNAAVDVDLPFKTDDQVAKETNLLDQKVTEGLNDYIHTLNVENNAGIADNQPNDKKGAVTDTAFTDGVVCSTLNNLSCSNRRKSITEVAEEGVHSNKLSAMVITEDVEELHAVPSVTPRMSADCSAFSPTFSDSKFESKSLESHIDSPQLTSWEMNMVFGSGDKVDVEKSAGGISEANSITQYCEDAVLVKEDLNTTELVDQQIVESHLDEQEYHTHGTVSDEPIYDNQESNQKIELASFNQEHIDCKIQKDKSHVSAEMLLIEAAATSFSSIADLEGFNAEYVSDDSKVVDNIAINAGVSNCSGSRGNSTDEVHIEPTKTMDVQEVENVGTIEPVTPKDLCTGGANLKEKSNEITGTILKKIFSSGSRCEEKDCTEMNKCDIQNEDYSTDAGRKEMDDEDLGNISSSVALLFQEDTEAKIGKSKAPDSFSLEHDARDSLEVVKDQLDELERAANEGMFRDCVCCLGLNHPSCGEKSKRHEVVTEEADGLYHFDDKVVPAGDSKKVVDFKNYNIASTSIPEMAVDCCAISPDIFSSNSENKAIELKAEKDDVKNSEAVASETNSISEDARDVKDAMTMEQVAAQVTEEKISEHKTAEEEASENMSLKYESPKFENANSASDRNVPIGDNEELNQKIELSLFNHEHVDCEKDKSYVSAEGILIEAAARSGSKIADLGGLKAEYVSDEAKDAENFSVDPSVLNHSRSRRNSADKDVHTEATQTMNMQEVEFVGTIQPVSPNKLCTGFENPKDTSHEVSEEMNERAVSNEDYSNDAGRTNMAGEDTGNILGHMALLFQEDTEATIGKSKAADVISTKHYARDFGEVSEYQLDEREVAANDATFKSSICCLGLNQPLFDDASKSRGVEADEADGLHLDDKVVTAGDSKKVIGFENSNVASTIPEMAVDCSGIYTVFASSNCENEALELNVESHIFTSREMNLFLGPYAKDDVENSEAGALETDIVSDDAMEHVSAKFTEEQIPENKTAGDVSELDSNLHSDVDEPKCRGDKASTEQENMLNIVQGAFGNTNSAAGPETVAEDPWELELKLLSPRPKSPEAKTGRGNSLFAKNLNSSTRKQKSKSTLIQRTPKPKLLIHDMKENLLSTKREKPSNMTAEKTLSKRRALEDLRKK